MSDGKAPEEDVIENNVKDDSISLSGEMRTKFVKVLDNLNDDHQTPWIKKPASVFVVLSLFISLLGLVKKESDFQKKELELRNNVTRTQADFNKQTLNLAALGRDLKNVEKQLAEVNSKKNDEQKKYDELVELKNDMEEQLSKFYRYIDSGGVMTDEFVYEFLDPAIMTLPRNPKFGIGAKYIVSMFMEYPAELAYEIQKRVHSISPIPDTFKITGGDTLSLTSGDIQINLLESGGKKRWGMYYTGNTTVESFSVQLRVKHPDKEAAHSCFILSYPQKAAFEEVETCDV